MEALKENRTLDVPLQTNLTLSTSLVGGEHYPSEQEAPTASERFLEKIKQGDGLFDQYITQETNRIYGEKYDSEKALSCKEQAYQVYRELASEAAKVGNREFGVRALYRLGVCYHDYEKDRYEEALEIFLEAKKLSEGLNDKAITGSIAGRLGDSYLELGNVDKALFYYKEAATCLDTLEPGKLGEAALERDVVRDLSVEELKKFDFNKKSGKQCRINREYNEAIQYLEKAQLICEKFLKKDKNDAKVRERLWETQLEIGETYYDERLFLEAEGAYQKLIKYPFVDANILAKAYLKLGDVYRFREDSDRAVEFYKAVLELKEVDPYNKDAAFNRLITIAEKKDQVEEVEQWYRAALSLCEKEEDPKGSAILFTALGDFYRKKGKLDEAMKCFNKCIATIPEEEDGSHEPYIRAAYIGLAKCYLEKGDYKFADNAITAGFKLSRDNHCFDRPLLNFLAGELYFAQKKNEQAFHLFKLARDGAIYKKNNELWVKACEKLCLQPKKERRPGNWEGELEQAAREFKKQTDLEVFFVEAHLDVHTFFAHPIIDSGQFSPFDFLEIAIKKDRFMLVEGMLLRWADVLQPIRRDRSGQNSLHWAAKYGSLYTLKYLNRNYSNLINQKDNEGRTPIQVAALYGQIEVVCFFNESCGISIACLDEQERSLLHHAACGNEDEMCQYLLKAFERENVFKLTEAWDVTGQAPIHAAAQNGALEVLKVFETADFDLDLPDADGNTPLHYLAQKGNPEGVKALINWGASCSLTNYKGEMPAQVASIEGVKRILEAKAVEERESAASDSPKIHNLVLKGGGVKGAAYAGAIRESLRKGLFVFEDIKRVGGASAGSIAALLIALDYSISDMEEFLKIDISTFLDEDDLKIKKIFIENRHKEFTFNLSTVSDVSRLVQHIYKRKGLFRGDKLLSWFQDRLENKLSSRLGKPRAREATFQDLHDCGCRDLHVVAVNTSTHKAETFNWERTPDYCVADAIRSSMAIPLFFEPWHQHYIEKGERKPVSNVFYVDGGTFENLPIQLFDQAKYMGSTRLRHSTQRKVNPETLAFSLTGLEKPESLPKGEPSVFSYLFSLVQTLTSMKKQTSDLKRSGDVGRIIEIFNAGVDTVDFNITPEELKNLIDEGERAVIRHIESRKAVKPPVSLSTNVLSILATQGALTVERGQVSIQNVVVTTNQGALVCAAAQDDNLRLIETLRIPCNAVDQKTKRNAFHWFALKGLCSPTVIEALLRKKCDPNLLDDDGNSPLDLAVKEGHHLSTWLLSQKGATACKDQKAVQTSYTTGAQEATNRSLVEINSSFTIQSIQERTSTPITAMVSELHKPAPSVGIGIMNGSSNSCYANSFIQVLTTKLIAQELDQRKKTWISCNEDSNVTAEAKALQFAVGKALSQWDCQHQQLLNNQSASPLPEYYIIDILKATQAYHQSTGGIGKWNTESFQDFLEFYSLVSKALGLPTTNTESYLRLNPYDKKDITNLQEFMDQQHSGLSHHAMLAIGVERLAQHPRNQHPIVVNPNLKVNQVQYSIAAIVTFRDPGHYITYRWEEVAKSWVKCDNDRVEPYPYAEIAEAVSPDVVFALYQAGQNRE